MLGSGPQGQARIVPVAFSAREAAQTVPEKIGEISGNRYSSEDEAAEGF